MNFPIEVEYEFFIDSIDTDKLEDDQIKQLLEILDLQNIDQLDNFSEVIATYSEYYDTEDDYLEKFGSKDIRYNSYWSDMVTDEYTGIANFCHKHSYAIETYAETKIVEDYKQLELKL
jgi:hypothetical protein